MIHGFLLTIIRQASVSIRACDDGSFSITVRINKVMGEGAKSQVVGRDTELEQVILNRLNGQQDQQETSPAGSPAGSTKVMATEKKND